ncbi:AraC family transcriptional regulator [Rhodococcus sp. NCIMB 12038]|uniref:AraC family transcriptional regulator n=1 Tax=Rhodococcus sp. NCIMB 12038 TaxID=933800 RepID=UPI000B3D139B|nr:AraC family transcriptional regulator [Rhodococcus sp. NCIMB 12038]OUS85075.1 AraC family transcriptional regulator [Rhodococcus sp. NCIMB 12038]
MDARPLARYAALHGYIELGESLGIDSVGLLRAAGLDPAGMDVQDRWLPAAAISRVLESSAEAAGREDFALLLAQHRRFSNLGPLSVSVREAPDARSAFETLIRYQHMYNEALRTRLSERRDLTTLIVDYDTKADVGTRQALELATAVGYQLLRTILGDAWRPVAVCFQHGPPSDTGTHRKVFDADVRFNQHFTGMIITTSDLRKPNRMSDPMLRAYTRTLLESVETAGPPTVLTRVRELIELLLPTGRCSLDQVSRSLGVDRKTVHRHLAQYGETFTSVLNSTRVGLAERLVADNRYSLTEIAEMLAFSTPNSFSRWFRQNFGVSPRTWRASAQAGVDPSAR